MNEPKHTPGPWAIAIEGTCSAAWPHIIAESRDADDAICELPACFLSRKKQPCTTYTDKPKDFKQDENYEEIMANARLIAAAPDLLEALESLLFIHENVDETGYVTDVGFYPVEAEIEKARKAITKAGEGISQ